ncbi:MAG: sugar ABC transporter permease [Gammaproteobacteria bacterium]
MPSAAAASATARIAWPRRWVARIGIDTRLLGMVAMLILIWIAFDVATQGVFLSPRNLFNLALQVSVVGIMASAMTLVIVARHIDLSVGSLLGFIGMFGALAQTVWLPAGAWYNWIAACVAMLALGALIGALQGYWVAYRGVPAFVVTLAGLLIFRNAAWLLSEGRTIAPLDETFQLIGGGIEGTIGAFWSWVVGAVASLAIVWYGLRTRRRRQRYGFPVKPLALEWLLMALAVGLVAAFVQTMNAYQRPRTEIASGIPIPFLILIVVTLAMAILAKATKFGRYVYAIGGRPESAVLAGIDVKRITLYIFMIMGGLSALAAIVITARLNAAASVTGTMTELNVIAAAVIGGVSLTGGVGTVFGAVLGAVFMQSLESGMVLLGVPTPVQRIVIGVVLVLAVWVDVVVQRRRR